jgi:cell division protein ZapE
MGPGFVPRLREVAHEHGFALDAAQERVALAFERLEGELAAAERDGSGLRRWLRRRPAVKGIYLWGPVGRGKSFLMDAFFLLARIERKRRVHFHRFMQDIHHRLRALQGRRDPLRAVARDTGRGGRLLCLDELHVADIGDAMLMRGLLERLFELGVVLVTTSNQHPDELYLHGLQRAQFIPAIELMKQHLEVVELTGGSDYRLRTLEKAGVYHFPLGEPAEAAQKAAFLGVAGEAGEVDVALEIDGRRILARHVGAGTVWFGFAELCEEPRGTADYIELARRYHTVLISGVPKFRPSMAESLRRFTWLVDEFYDRRVKLILSADAPLEALYQDIEPGPDIERARSRLIEMQTSRYLSAAHLA